MTLNNVGVDDFLQRGFLPKELPGAFSSNQLTRQMFLQKPTVISRLPPVTLSLSTPKNPRRELSIPHPAAYAELCEKLCPDISTITSRSAASLSAPIASQKRAIEPENTLSGLEAIRVRHRANTRFVLKADISSYYHSLYTHAVAWALSPNARQDYGKAIFGNNIDTLIRALQLGRSHGIPVGPDASFFIAEAVLASIDGEIASKLGQPFVRWYDDYEVPCTSHSDASRAYTIISESLRSFHLNLNQSKSRLVELPERPDAFGWTSSIEDIVQTDELSERSILMAFDRALEARRAGELGPIQYLLGRLRKADLAENVCDLAFSYLSQLVLAEEGGCRKAFQLIHEWRSRKLVDEEKVELLRQRILERWMDSQVSIDAAWVLDDVIRTDSTLPKHTLHKLIQRGDPIVATQIVHMWSRDLCSEEDAKNAVRLTGQEPSWLVFFEATKLELDMGKLSKVDKELEKLLDAHVSFVHYGDDSDDGNDNDDSDADKEY